MSSRQLRFLLIALGLSIALTRLMAVAHSLWEWDEVLFCHSLRDFNVAAHHPHPPGYPLYVVLGRFFRLFVADDFRALRTINLLCSMLIFPGMYLLARELRMEVVPAMLAAVLTCFAPNVWFYGGTAFTDIPALALLLFGAALLLRGRTSRAAYFAGCLIMAAACVMRPQNALFGAYPWLVSSWPRWKERKLDPILGGVLLVSFVGAFFLGAAYFTGFDAFRAALKAQSAYVMSVDSYQNPYRVPWYRTVGVMLVDPYGAEKVSRVIAAFALLGALRFRRPAREALAIFAPFVIFSLFMLNPDVGGRYSTASMPLLMICCAEGIRWISAPVDRRSPAFAIGAQCVIAGVILTRLISWTMPALREARRHDSPPIEAARWVRRHLDPQKITLYVQSGLQPLAEYLLGDYRRVDVPDDFSAASVSNVRDCWFLSDGMTTASDGVTFVRPRSREIYAISRKRYFEAFVCPLASSVSYGRGWYGEESGGNSVWRWMGGQSTTYLPSMTGEGVLGMSFDVPLDAEPRKPIVTVVFNGTVIDRFQSEETMERRWTVASKNGGPNELIVEVDEVVNPIALHRGTDPRDLGLRLHSLSWRQAGPK